MLNHSRTDRVRENLQVGCSFCDVFAAVNISFEHVIVHPSDSSSPCNSRKAKGDLKQVLFRRPNVGLARNANSYSASSICSQSVSPTPPKAYGRGIEKGLSSVRLWWGSRVDLELGLMQSERLLNKSKREAGNKVSDSPRVRQLICSYYRNQYLLSQILTRSILYARKVANIYKINAFRYALNHTHYNLTLPSCCRPANQEVKSLPLLPGSAPAGDSSPPIHFGLLIPSPTV